MTTALQVLHSPGRLKVTQHDDLERLVSAAPDGAILELPAGTYTWTKPLLLRKALTLVGQGAELTVINVLHSGEAINVVQSGTLSLRDLTLHRHEASNRALVQSSGAALSIAHCHLRGSSVKPAGSGVTLKAKGTATICDCTITVFETAIATNDHVNIVAISNIIKNVRQGLTLGGHTQGLVERNTLLHCANNAIVLTGHAQPVLEDNVCDHPHNAGIVFYEHASGTAHGNRCIGGRYGLRACNQAHPTLLGNRCTGQEEAAILFEGQTEGTIQGNICQDGVHGIVIQQGAWPMLRGNTIRNNSKTDVLPPGMMDLPIQQSSALSVIKGEPRALTRGVWASGALPKRSMGLAYLLMFSSFLIGGWLSGVVMLTGSLVMAACLLGGRRGVMLHRGLVLAGRVVEQEASGQIAVLYTDPYGQDRQYRARVSRDLTQRYPVGSGVDVLIDPNNPDLAVVPKFKNVDYAPQELAEDNRPVSLPFRRRKLRQPPHTTMVRATLLPTLRPSSSVRLLSRHHKHAALGHLLITPESLILEPTNRDAILELRWENPIVVHLSVWLLSQDTIELVVTLRTRNGGQTGLAFKTELPQSAVARSVPIKQRVAPYVCVEDFKQIWPIVCHHAALAGQRLDTLVTTAPYR